MIMAGYITYEEDVNMQSLDEWLDMNLPSQVYREDGVSWISVHRKDCSPPCGGCPVALRVQKLQEDWLGLHKTAMSITRRTIEAIASKNELLVGKWLYYSASGNEADMQWKRVSRGIIMGLVPTAFEAKISTNENTKGSGRTDREHVICVYSKNFLDKADVTSVERGLRDIGVVAKMFYKPDAYTHLGIYSQNPHGISASIYHSNFNTFNKTSKIIEM